MLLEVLILPGGIAGIVGGGLIVVGIILAYDTYGSTAGHITLMSTLGFSLLMVILAIRNKTWNKIMLKSELKGSIKEYDEVKVKIGDVGETISRLAPMGKVKINDEYIEVHTLGEFIDHGSKVKIINIKDNKIFVSLIK